MGHKSSEVWRLNYKYKLKTMGEIYSEELNKEISKSNKENFELEKSEIRKNAEKVEKFMKIISVELRREGLPIGNDGRIDARAFKRVYSNGEMDSDKNYVKDRENSFKKELLEKGLIEEEIEEGKLTAESERFERLKTAVMHKAFGEKFAVARSSRYDDIKNGIDNVIMEKETGNIVCAVDDVAADENSERFKEKKKRVMEKNMSGGGTLKYGITKNRGKKYFNNIPIFWLDLNKEDLIKAEENFNPLEKELSDNGKELASDFLSSIREQIEFFMEKPHLNSAFRKNLVQNEKTLKKLEEM